MHKVYIIIVKEKKVRSTDIPGSLKYSANVLITYIVSQQIWKKIKSYLGNWTPACIMWQTNETWSIIDNYVLNADVEFLGNSPSTSSQDGCQSSGTKSLTHAQVQHLQVRVLAKQTVTKYERSYIIYRHIKKNSYPFHITPCNSPRHLYQTEDHRPKGCYWSNVISKKVWIIKIFIYYLL